MKFRVRDITNNKFITPIYKAYEGKIFEPYVNINGELCFKYKGMKELPDGEYHVSYLTHELGIKYEVNWCTGVKDKYETDIYENDIIELNRGGINIIGGVILYKGYWIVYDGYNSHGLYSDYNDTKVIGNKYDYPNLSK